MKIAFIWQGCSEPEIFNRWNDGCRAAMRIVEKEHEVRYYEPWDEFEADLIFYWEAPCTINGPNGEHWNRVRKLPTKKILLFAGGPLKKEWVEGFDLLLVESKVNADECAALGIPYDTAFGVNTDLFKPVPQNKIFDATHHGTFAGWKHQALTAEALGNRLALAGRFQSNEQTLIDDSVKFGALVLPQLPFDILPYLICSGYVCVNMSSEWGGGQRTTLEAMACGIPVICRTDSMKNREYVEESGFGAVISPSVPQIREAVARLKEAQLNPQIGIDYVNSKFTHHHYADKLLNHINAFKLS